jgi:ribosomal protein L11 methyltransferase
MRQWLHVVAAAAGPVPDWSVWHEAFVRAGADGTVEGQDGASLEAYLPEDKAAGLGPLALELFALGAVRLNVAPLEEAAWAESWKQYFRPLRVGRGIVVRPSWEEGGGTGEVEVVLDPGQAFGTGSHPTTRMCLEMLESELDARPQGCRVVDFGCGSGILAVYAALRGADAVAYDNDPLCIEATQDNARRNGVVVPARLVEGMADVASSPADVVVSNIVSAVLAELAPHVAGRLAPGGVWIMSGIVPEHWPPLEAALQEAGFATDTPLEVEGWMAASARLSGRSPGSS